MPDRILTSPFRVSGPLRLAQLTVVVSADALVRRARAQGRDVELRVCILAGDLAGQAAVERELAREGHDRISLGREGFVDRVKAAEASNRAAAQSELDLLAVGVDLESSALDNADVIAAARNAFVRLYEAGMLVREERVVDVCTRCETVIDPADADATELAADLLHLRLGAPDCEIELGLVSAEFLPGAVAVVVPEGHAAVGQTVEVPLAGELLVVGDDVAEARLVFPAHDADDLDLARRMGAPTINVLDRDGTVVADGPLQGLGRFAARQAAAKVLTDDGVVADVTETAEPGSRCRRCGTVLVPHLGPHWFLPMAEIEIAAADAVRDGLVDVIPATARDAFLERAGAGGDWCVSHQVWAGESVPASACSECRQMTVAIDPGPSCNRCMGALEPVSDVLDARFLAAVWPLAIAGWPAEDAGVKEAAEATTLLVDPAGVARWTVAWTALALRLTGAVPFARVAAQEAQTTGDDPDPLLAAPIADLLAHVPIQVLRTALVAGGLDLDSAGAFVEQLADPADGEADISAVTAAYDEAFAAGLPASGLAVLVTALAEGLGPEVAERVQALAAPIVG